MTSFRPALAPDLLRGKTAWITGGGTGLGRAMALRFAALGASVALSGRRLEPLEAVAGEIVEAGPVDGTPDGAKVLDLYYLA